MNKLETLSAAAALSKIAEIRQLGLAQDYSDLLTNKSVIELDEKAEQATGISMLNYKSKLSLRDIETYESYLDRVVENNISQKISNGFLADELEMLSVAKPFPLNSFRTFTITNIASAVKEILNPLGIITPSIIPLVKSATKVEQVDSEQVNFLVLSSTTIRSKQVLVLFHVTLGDYTHIKEKSKGIKNMFEKIGNNRVLDAIVISSCFLISPYNKLLDEDSLVHLFIQGILKYGRETTIGNQTRKFFLKGYSSSLLINPNDEIKVDDKFAKRINGTVNIKSTLTGYEYNFAYNTSIEPMIRDYKQGKFLV